MNFELMYFWLSCLVSNFELKVTSAKKRQPLEMCHLRRRSRIFLFRKEIKFRFQDIQVSVFLTIP